MSIKDAQMRYDAQVPDYEIYPDIVLNPGDIVEAIWFHGSRERGMASDWMEAPLAGGVRQHRTENRHRPLTVRDTKPWATPWLFQLWDGQAAELIRS